MPAPVSSCRLAPVLSAFAVALLLALVPAARAADAAPTAKAKAAAAIAMPRIKAPADAATDAANAAPNAAPAAAPATPASPAVAVPVAAPGSGAAPATAPSPAASPAVDAATGAALDNRIQDVKGDVIRLNRDLLVLEEELLFPASTQVALFVSMDVGKLFSLDSVKIKLDDKDVTNYLYTAAEVAALHRGGVQRVYVGNLKSGSHELVAFFTGKGPHTRDYKRGTTVKFDKGTEPKYIELQIRDSEGKLQPEFDIKVWQ